MCECACGEDSNTAATKFKVGDFVRIVSSTYTEHPARMAGSVGVVRYVDHGYLIEVNDDTFDTWFFTEDELEKIA